MLAAYVSFDYYRIALEMGMKCQPISELLTRINDAIPLSKRNNSLSCRELFSLELIGIEPTTY